MSAHTPPPADAAEPPPPPPPTIDDVFPARQAAVDALSSLAQEAAEVVTAVIAARSFGLVDKTIADDMAATCGRTIGDVMRASYLERCSDRAESETVAAEAAARLRDLKAHLADILDEYVAKHKRSPDDALWARTVRGMYSALGGGGRR